MLKFSLLLFVILFNLNIEMNYQNKEIYYSNDTSIEEVIGKIEIPRINLLKKLYDKSSINNNVDKNLMMIADLPSIDSKVIIAGHSGVGENAYFNDLVYLVNNDKIFIYYKDFKYEYVLIDKYDIKKTGKLYLGKDENGILVLITCKIGTTDIQTVYKSKLNNIYKM